MSENNNNNRLIVHQIFYKDNTKWGALLALSPNDNLLEATMG